MVILVVGNGRVERGEDMSGAGLVGIRFLVGELSSARRIALTAIFFRDVFSTRKVSIFKTCYSSLDPSGKSTKTMTGLSHR